MKVGIFGTGDVGKTLAAGLVRRGHDVMLGTRDVRRKMEEKAEDAGSVGFRDWISKNKKVRLGTFSEAGGHGHLLFNATAGHGSLAALATVKAADLREKILIDVANALGPWGEGPIELFVANTDSLAEMIQRAHPGVRVVKALNTMNALIMVEPARVAGGEHDLFLCGNDGEAKQRVTALVKDEFGWKSVIDLGDIGAARGMEMSLPFWLRLYGVFQSPAFNYRIVR